MVTRQSTNFEYREEYLIFEQRNKEKIKHIFFFLYIFIKLIIHS